MKVAVVNRHDVNGGAARAAFRIFEALRENDIDAEMLVSSASSSHPYVMASTDNMPYLRNVIGTGMARLVTFNAHETLSPALLGSSWPEKINASTVDVVNLHWINGEMLSIGDISRIKKPIVWTLHDMWAFCGAEHYTEHSRWREGYSRVNRPVNERGLDLNKWVWSRKHIHWKQAVHIVTPSHWLANCVRESALMRGWPVSVIHNAIDTDFWKPGSKVEARKRLRLPLDSSFVTFGAIGGSKDPRKGFDLLTDALSRLRRKVENLHLIVVGQNKSKKLIDIGLPIHFMGHVSDDSTLLDIYNASDVLIIPSRQDNLPNVGVEAMACGVPIVSFDTCGLPDLVVHKQTGYLAKPFDCEGLAEGIRWTLDQQYSENRAVDDEYRSPFGYALSCNCRDYAVSHFSYSAVAKQYALLFHEKVQGL